MLSRPLARSLVVALTAACAAPDDPVSDPGFPAPSDLPERVAPPDPFVGFDGTPVRDAGDWNRVRRPEVLALFEHYVYGRSAVAPEVRVVRTATDPFPGGEVRQLELDVGGVPVDVAVFVPAGAAAAPVFVGLNKCGNGSVTHEVALWPTRRWVEPECADEDRAAWWSLDLAMAANVAVATVHQSDFAPDDAGSSERPAPLGGDPATAWGAVAAWSWGLSAVAVALREQPGLDPDRIVAFGHSRRGKAALWAAAADPAFAGVWSHQSGTGGAALSRSYEGESIAAVTAFFPHWFGSLFAEFAGRETYLPVDQHLLVAAVAPRRVRLTDGDDDAWADPAGSQQSAALAAPVFELLGAEPAGWSSRPGGHEVRPEDWEGALAWLASW